LGSLVLPLVCGISGRSRAIEVVLRQKRAWLIDCEGSIAKLVPLRKCAMEPCHASMNAMPPCPILPEVETPIA